MAWDKDEVLADLVKKFGKEFKDEISDSLTLDEGRWDDFGQCGKFEADGIEYNLIPSEDEADKIAIKYVEQELDEEPELFTQDWLSNFITISDTDRRVIASDESDSYIGDLSDEEIVERFGEKTDVDLTEDEINDLRDKAMDEYYDEVYESLADPIKYFVEEQGIYTREDLLKQNFIMIDTEEAAKDAVSTDGASHFLSLYDGEFEYTDGGLVYFRE